jgi:hypothetical protein
MGVLKLHLYVTGLQRCSQVRTRTQRHAALRARARGRETTTDISVKDVDVTYKHELSWQSRRYRFLVHTTIYAYRKRLTNKVVFLSTSHVLAN